MTGDVSTLQVLVKEHRANLGGTHLKPEDETNTENPKRGGLHLFLETRARPEVNTTTAQFLIF